MVIMVIMVDTDTDMDMDMGAITAQGILKTILEEETKANLYLKGLNVGLGNCLDKIIIVLFYGGEIQMNKQQSSQEIIIESGRSEKNYWHDLWRFKELFYILSWRDIKVRYKQTVLGAAWGVIRPLLTMLVFTFVFGKLANLDNKSAVPYAIIVFAGLLPWQFFS